MTKTEFVGTKVMLMALYASSLALFELDECSSSSLDIRGRTGTLTVVTTENGTKALNKSFDYLKKGFK